MRIAHRSGQRGRSNGANAKDRHKPSGDFALTLPGKQIAFNLADLGMRIEGLLRQPLHDAKSIERHIRRFGAPSLKRIPLQTMCLWVWRREPLTAANISIRLRRQTKHCCSCEIAAGGWPAATPISATGGAVGGGSGTVPLASGDHPWHASSNSTIFI